MSRVRFFGGIIKNLFLEWLINLPGEEGIQLRYRYYRRKLRQIGKDVRIDVGVYIQNPEFVTIGNSSWIDRNVILLAGVPGEKRETIYKENIDFSGQPGEVIIGNNVHIAPFVLISGIAGVKISDRVGVASGSKIYSYSHHYRSTQNPDNRNIVFTPMVEPEYQSMISGPIFIGESSGLAINCVVLPGVSIGKQCFALANSLITANMPKNSLIAGMPAKVIGERFK